VQRRLEALKRLIEIRIVPAVLYTRARMSDGRPIALKIGADL
jgi:hypothetical protein